MKQTTPLPIHVIRRGLPALARGIRSGKPATIVWLGGSITQAWPDGYAYQTTDSLKARYPNVSFTGINAGIGGTRSDLGAYRLRQDVLIHKPTLLIIEFACNDSEEDHAVQAAMEGIVRHARRVLGAECDIVFVYTLAQWQLDELQAERLPPGARLHEPVAEHYGIPSVNAGLDAARRLKAGELTWADFAQDSCHPLPRGHQLYCHTLERFIEEAIARPETPFESWPAPMTEAPWEHADMVPIASDTSFTGWNFRPMENRGGWQCFDGLFESDIAGSEASFEFSGTTIGLFYHLGPESGDIAWAVDDGDFATARVFDGHSEVFWRPHYRILAEGLPPGRHLLRVRVGTQCDARSKGHWVKLASLLVR